MLRLEKVSVYINRVAPLLLLNSASGLKSRWVDMSDRKSHWEKIYADKAPPEVSWYQNELALSLSLINNTHMLRVRQSLMSVLVLHYWWINWMKKLIRILQYWILPQMPLLMHRTGWAIRQAGLNGILRMWPASNHSVRFLFGRIELCFIF